jgi:hypothetical protein
MPAKGQFPRDFRRLVQEECKADECAPAWRFSIRKLVTSHTSIVPQVNEAIGFDVQISGQRDSSLAAIAQ